MRRLLVLLLALGLLGCQPLPVPVPPTPPPVPVPVPPGPTPTPVPPVPPPPPVPTDLVARAVADELVAAINAGEARKAPADVLAILRVVVDDYAPPVAAGAPPLRVIGYAVAGADGVALTAWITYTGGLTSGGAVR